MDKINIGLALTIAAGMTIAYVSTSILQLIFGILDSVLSKLWYYLRRKIRNKK